MITTHISLISRLFDRSDESRHDHKTIARARGPDVALFDASRRRTTRLPSLKSQDTRGAPWTRARPAMRARSRLEVESACRARGRHEERRLGARVDRALERLAEFVAPLDRARGEPRAAEQLGALPARAPADRNENTIKDVGVTRRCPDTPPLSTARGRAVASAHAAAGGGHVGARHGSTSLGRGGHISAGAAARAAARCRGMR